MSKIIFLLLIFKSYQIKNINNNSYSSDYTLFFKNQNFIINNNTNFIELEKYSLNFINKNNINLRNINEDIEYKLAQNIIKDTNDVINDCINQFKSGTSIKNYIKGVKNNNYLANENYSENFIIKTIVHCYIYSEYNKIINKNNPKLSDIDLDTCKNYILAQISSNEYFYIIKTDIIRNDYKKNIVKFSFYFKNGTLINIEEECSIIISSPINILDIEEQKQINITLEQNYDIFDKNNKFYNNLCTPFKSEYETDLLIEDRRKYYYLKYYDICENNCDYIGYINNTGKIQCNCTYNNINKYEKNIIDDFEKQENNFEFKKKFKLSHIKCFKCYLEALVLKNIIKNNIIWVMNIVFIGNFILFGFYLNKGFVQINKIFNKINNDIKLKNIFEPPKRIFGNTKINNPIELKENNPPNYINENSKVKVKKFNYVNNILLNNDSFKDKNPSSERKIFIENFKKKLDEKIKFLDIEYNKMSFDDAFLFDKRGYCKYYFSIIRNSQLILFTFYNNNDYNLNYIKYSLFLNCLSFYIVFNVLFYFNCFTKNIYKNKGKYDFIYHLPKIILSTFCTIFINFLFKLLVLTQNNILSIKKIKDCNKMKIEYNKFIHVLKIKLIIFYSINLSLLALNWYYIAAFFSIFKYSKKHLLKDILISFSLDLIYPFLLTIIPTILRIQGIKKNIRILYNISKCLQLIC